MIELRELLEADALTASEVGRFADSSSHWITVEAAEDLIERLHPVPRSSADSDSAPRSGNSASSRDAGRPPSRRSEPRDRVTAAAGSSSDVTSPGPGRSPPDAAGPGHPDPIAEAFWAKADRSGGPDACWPWMGARNWKGYGRFYDRSQGGMRNASWMALAYDGRPVSPGFLACHHCDNPPCVNPAHLYVGTLSTNALDMYARGRGYRRPPRTECSAGHPLSGPNLLLKKASWGIARRCRTCEYATANARRRRQRAAQRAAAAA